MNIAVFTDTFLPMTDGVVSMILNSSRELIRRGHRVKIFAPKIEGVEKYIKNLRNLEIVFYKSMDTPNEEVKLSAVWLPKTIRELKAFKTDVVHFHSPSMIGIEGIIAAKILHIPIVATFHTFLADFEYMKSIGIPKILIKLSSNIIWKLLIFIYEKADAIISPCKYTKKVLLEKKIKKPIIVIPNGIKFNNKQLEFNKKSSNCLYVGRLGPEKNLETLVKTFKFVANKIPSAKLIVVGDGPKKKTMQNLAKQLKISKKIIFKGKIENEKLMKKGEIFKKCALFINTALAENQPVSVIEAMSFGLPIVAIKTKGMPELVNGNGFLCENANPKEIAENAIKILRNQNLRYNFSKASLQKAKKYNISYSVKKLENLYEGLKKITR